MSDSFVVKANPRVVGVAMRCSGYQFYASDPDFRPLEHRRFRRARMLTRSVGHFAQHLTPPDDGAKPTRH